jgi:WD40 repeat protein/tRNA A-37 threonylcarbamoyl transferase component Bud32
MTRAFGEGRVRLPPEVSLRLDQLCDQFEAACKDGKSPQIDVFLAGWGEPARTALEGELLQLDQYYRLCRAKTNHLANGRPRFPPLETNRDITAGGATAAGRGTASPQMPLDALGADDQSSKSLEGPNNRDSASFESFHSGCIFGGYELLEFVARGGMGVVFKARQRKLGRVVALKMIVGGQLASPDDVQRFRSEAAAAARLDHPTIVPIYEVGEHDGRHYFSMAFVDGVSLAERLREGPLEPRAAARVVRDLAAAIQVAHENGIIHRDLKPANVLLDKNGLPKLTDFGLAKRTDQVNDMTGTGQVIGTPAYMAPEQAEGGQSAIGPTTDVYGLGALLFALLTGRPPFQAATVIDTLHHVISLEPPRPTALNPAIPRDLETISLKCLQKAQTSRYANAAALRDDLDRFLTDRPILARPVGIIERCYRWCRRRPAAAAAIALAIVLAVGGPSAAWLFKGQRDDAQFARADALEKLRDAFVSRASAGRTGGRAGRRFDSLDALAEAARIRPGPELRNEAIGCLTLADLRMARQWPAPPGGTQRIEYDNAFVRYVHVSQNGRVSVRRVADNSEEMEVPRPGRGEVWPTLSRDGRYLHLGVNPDQRQQVWRIDSPTPASLIDLHLKEFANPAFRPDNGRIAVAAVDGPIGLYDLPSGQFVRQLPNPGRILQLVYDPTGQRLAAATPDGAKIIDAETGVLQLELHSAPTAGFEWLAWHPQGDRIAAAGADGGIRLWDVARDKVLHVLEARPGGLFVEFNHAGDLLASISWDGLLRLWNPDTGKLALCAPYSWGFIRFSADDRWLAGDQWDGQIRLWEVAQGRECRTLLPDRRIKGTGGSGFAIHPDGRWLAIALDDGIDLWDIDANRQITHLRTGLSGSIQFEASGALVAEVHYAASAFRWPVTASRPNEYRLGPPECIPLPAPVRAMAITPDGRVAATTGDRRTAFVFNRDRSEQLVRLGPLADARNIAVSPNGRLVVTSDYHIGGGLKVWNLDNPNSARLLRQAGQCGATFNMNGTLLATKCAGTGGLTFDGQVWDVGAWNENYHFDGWPLAFSPDGAVLAIGTSQGAVRLLESSTGVEIARLEDPNLERALEGHFTPDGSALLTCSGDGPGIRVWDLRLIRSELAERGLDWALPSYPPPAKGDPVRIEVVSNEPFPAPGPPP